MKTLPMEPPRCQLLATAISVAIVIGGAPIRAEQDPARQQKTATTVPARSPLVRVVDLNTGEEQQVTLSNGKKVAVHLVKLVETRDSVRSAVRRAEVTVQVDGRTATIGAAMYDLPITLGDVQIDCSITKGIYANTNADSWGLEKDARLRLWPADSPLQEPESFLYPVRQRWFASGTQMANEPTFVDGVERPSVRKIYYHSGEDIGGAEGMVEVVAATDALVVSSGLNVLDGHRRADDPDTPVGERYDVVYLLDNQGWYYRYSHLHEIDGRIVPGRTLRKGERVGVLGKEGASGGWSHLHFEIKSRQPSGKWGTQAAYAFLWEAYRKQYKPKLQAVARPHHLVFVGENVTLDGSKSWIAVGKIARFEWELSDGTKAAGPTAVRTYLRAGEFSEVLKVTDTEGQVDYDFAVVQVIDRDHPDDVPPGIHAAYSPTLGIRPGDPVTFKARTFGTTEGSEAWNFGDGSDPVETRSDGNVTALAKDGYALTVHRFEKSGHYLVRVSRSNQRGDTALTHLYVRVGGEE